MVFKMLAIDRSWMDSHQSDVGKPRQVFLTQSYLLVRKVEEYFSRLVESYTTANLSFNELKRLAVERDRTHQAPPSRLVNHNEENRWDSTLPRRYGELKIGRAHV